MSITQLLETLSQQGVKLWANGDRLRYRAPKGVLTASQIAELKARKAEIIAALQGKTQSSLYPLSHGQKALWFLHCLQPESEAYNVNFAAYIRSAIDPEALRQAFQLLVDRHPILRTTYTTRDGQPAQQIHPHQRVDFETIDVSSLVPEQVEQQVIRAARHPFNLETGNVLRVRLFLQSANHGIILLSIHHIACDYWSLTLLLNELRQVYPLADATFLTPLTTEYTDYVDWQSRMLASEQGKHLWDYWRQQLAGELPILNLPTDRPRPPVQTSNGSVEVYRLSPSLTQQLQTLSKGEGVTLYTTLLAAFKILLYRHTEQTDFFVGSSMAGRTRAEFENLVGYFVNPVALRADCSGNPTFKAFLSRVRRTVCGALEHQDYPFPLLTRRLQQHRDASRSPIFQVMFGMHQPTRFHDPNLTLFMLGERGARMQLGGLELESFPLSQQEGQFDLMLTIAQAGEMLFAGWRYNTDLFERATIVRFATQFEVLLNSIIRQPEARIHTLNLYTETERKQHMMKKQERQRSQRKQFAKIQPKAVSFSEKDLIQSDSLQPGQSLPLVIKPAIEQLDLSDWAKNHRDFLETNLLKAGAILFRGFDLQSVEEFETVAHAICPNLFGDYGDLPREGVQGKVYGSTPYPPEQAILFHNESSHLHCWALKIFFFCVQPAQVGGETPIVDCRQIYQQLDPRLREQLEQKGLLYVRHYTEGLDVSWQDFFHTDDRAVVEAYCQRAGMEFEWTEGNGLLTRKYRPAIVTHPKTGEKVFFNQIQLHHQSCLEPSVRQSLLSMFGEGNLPRQVYYGDGSEIEDSVVEEIIALYEKNKISFPWQRGDVLMLDNMLTAHGRHPYQGARKIVVAMGEMTESVVGEEADADSRS